MARNSAPEPEHRVTRMQRPSRDRRLSRAQRAVWLYLALLSLLTLASGIAVARLLPARLALWRLPSVASRPLARPGLVLLPVSAANSTAANSTAAGSTAGGQAAAGQAAAGQTAAGQTAARRAARPATRAGVARALSGLLGSAALGPHTGALVADLATGRVLFARNATAGFAPASTTKLATAVAALDTLGPGARLATSVLTGSRHTEIVLMGGGDPTLAAGSPPAADYPRPATLRRLAALTAAALRHRHQHTVRLGYDDRRYTGPQLAPGWPASYVTTGNVTPIQALEVDQGRLTATGKPEDADDPGNTRPRTFTPAADAARYFAGFLARDGIKVAAAPRPATAPRHPATLARVQSPPLAEVVAWMLGESNNVIAENLARQVAIASHRPASFAGAAAVVEHVLRRLGVTGDVHLVDGSGLSPRDRISPQALVQIIALAASSRLPQLRGAITGLPVAGFSGTLAPGGSIFGEAGKPALGLVRAKTGNLSTVATLAGLAYARDGQLLAFAFMADHVQPAQLGAAGKVIIRLATALAGCGCR
jgi:D-alanyl-D-alanine carboxypeptidase/D-alanyl-D-alanine-endopeptidase (penicillin-binding protein 4)